MREKEAKKKYNSKYLAKIFDFSATSTVMTPLRNTISLNDENVFMIVHVAYQIQGIPFTACVNPLA